MRPVPLEILLSRYTPVPESGCWIWDGPVEAAKGYGQVWFKGKTLKAHRFFYEQLRGVIPNNLTLDHLCRVRCCVNPDHLEAVSSRTNVLRGTGLSANFAKQTACKNGHEFTEANTYFSKRNNSRTCRTCMRAYQKIWNRNKRLKNRVA